jgi:hypothetical protein
MLKFKLPNMFIRYTETMLIKIVLVFIILIIITFPLLAEQHRTVPLDHRVYSIIEWAEVKGLIKHQVSVKPYASSTIIKLLEQIISNSQRLTAAEEREICAIIEELNFSYEEENTSSSILNRGLYSTYGDDLNIGVALGTSIAAETTFSLTGNNYYDFRTSLRPYIRSDILDFASIYMDFGLRFDKLDNRVFLDTDFTIPGEGFYLLLTEKGKRLKEIPDPEGRVFTGFDFYPEISLSFLFGTLQFRFGNYKRDWGTGINSLQLAGSARPFEGVEGYLEFSDWLRYSFITGSLGIFSLSTLGGEAFFSDNLDDRENYRFNTNYSGKRVEIDFTQNFTFGIYESCVWQKRFELAYLNPFGILFFQQNLYGDLDNMLAGVDFQWRFPGILKLHASVAATEMHEISPDRLFVAPRNIMGMQAGADFTLPVGLFSKLSVQYTKLDPFFYTHYTHTGEFLHPIYRDDLGAELETAFVNKGENLGYPLHPNSDEILVKANIGIESGWESIITVKYQRRSGQYGFRIDMPVPLGYEDIKLYDDKDFSGFIFEKNLFVECKIVKQLNKLPLRVFGSYRFGMSVDRDVTGYSIGSDSKSYYNYTYAEEWNEPVYSHALQIGFSLYK